VLGLGGVVVGHALAAVPLGLWRHVTRLLIFVSFSFSVSLSSLSVLLLLMR
jgi:hypothetical protein